jgi:homoserine kinase
MRVLRVPHEVVVPGSIANLGPGLDTLGLAVALYLRVTITKVIEDGAGRLNCRFWDGPIGGPNRIQQGFDSIGPRRRLPSLDVEVRSEIPLRGGLGSSAAATIAGIRLRELVDGKRAGDEILLAASKIEGHPDNAAAAILGGVTSCCTRGNGTIAVSNWPWPAKWRIVVATPLVELATAVSRRALPKRVPLGDTIFNVQHVALLLSALQTGKAADMREALQDRVHQPYRQALVPGLRRLLALRHPDVIGACLSGAGPTVAVFASGKRREGRRCRARRLCERAGTVHGENSEGSSGR